ncbi:3-hydroxybutyryl-CoA dehydrogenase; 3-hydroxyacyl-CoA dehydrogenase [hydrothermal vent metagenome]|uniref:3-hydroxybutyryl-CoA dehydrogenase 3-hydroxyacyl-CoA dehydrogenase n=1 Tax=hydrothermal vent metagenome TaxID=652676 RepID=A0A3B0VT98_9ZZZZ
MLTKFKNVGVIGAGTMGIGIAEVAASHNQQVYLFDLNYEFAKSAKQTMEKRLLSRVARGKITTQHRQQIIDNIIIVEDLTKLADCQLIIEAIIEDLQIKQNLFKQLQQICSANTLFASNTSSISITAIASVLTRPENMIGLHFFNPAPVMQLVEVIAGLRSSATSLNSGTELCKFWHKTVVLAKSSPGFIVNRVARPFYGEALKMLQEQVATAVTIDTLMVAAGFRMGPFTLMDLIGIDINLSVSETVFQSMYFDPRYRPSLIQQEMVAANLLGKKTGCGFYQYGKESPKPHLQYEAPQPAPKYVSLTKSSTQLDELVELLKASKHFIATEHEAGPSIQVGECAIMLSNGHTCTHRVQAIPQKYLAQIDLMLNFATCAVIHIAFDSNCPLETRQQIIGMFQQLDYKVIVSYDVPALVVMRIVCLLINAAADALENGVCSEADVDLAMQKGVNYPIGLLAWANIIGIDHVVATLDGLHQWFGDDRYRASPWLRRTQEYNESVQ